MHVEILAEEPSMAQALETMVPRIIPGHSFMVSQHQGKINLLKNLDARLRGYANMLTAWPELRVAVVVDRDDDDCKTLKKRLTDACATSGCKALCRIAIEELEAWFFGDVDALRAAYPRVPASLASKAKYRDPDAVRGGTWEALESVLQRAGYYPSGMPKIEVARRVAEHMQPDVNRSRSFQAFCDGLRDLVS